MKSLSIKTLLRVTAFAAVALFCVTVTGETKAMQAALPAIEAPALAQRLGAKTPPFILDVREPAEFAATNITGAHLIPLGELPARLSEIPKDKPVVVVCRSGNRSGRAALFLRENGYTNVENLTGGMIAWSRSCNTGKPYC